MRHDKIYPDYRVGERVAELMYQNYETATNICQVIKKERKTLYHKLHGEAYWTADEIQLLCNHYKVSADYLLFGKED